MNETLLLLLLVVILAAISGFLISALLEIRRAAKALGRFLEAAEGSIIPAAAEASGAMKGLKTAADEVSDVARDLKTLSSAIGDVSENVKQINNVIGNVPALIAGVTAGLKFIIEYYTRPRAEAADAASPKQEP